MRGRWFVIAALLQCGSDVTSNDAGTDAGGDATVGDASKDVSISDVSSNDASDASAGAECATPAAIDTSDAGPYCPGADASYCNGGTCCEQIGSGTPTHCGSGSTCTGSGKLLVWQCGQSSHCGSEEICCLNGFLNTTNGCPEVTQLAGTFCHLFAPCPSGAPQICATSSECDAGQTCAPFVAYAGDGGEVDLGYCR